MSSLVGRDRLARLVGEWRAEQLTDEQTADRILALLGSDAVWTKAYGHPLRGEILTLLRERGPLSPVRAFEQLGGASLGTISYHFRMLERLGVIERVDEVQRRGALEHIYDVAS